MTDRKRILIFSILVMAGGMFGTVAVTLAILYQNTMENEREELVELARSQARLLEAIVRHDELHDWADHPTGSVLADTTSIIIDAHEHYSGFGETGELVVARRESDQIVFIYPYRHGDGRAPDPIPWPSDRAEPMCRALSGQEGTLIGLDYRGERVLAAYHPVEVLDLGVVAKMDMAEIRAPFVVASAVAGGVTVLLVLVGVGMTLRVIDPLVRQLQESEERLRLTLDAVSDGGWDWNVATGEVRYSDRWLESLGYKRDEVSRHISFWESIVHPDDLPHTMEVLNAHFDGHTPSFECENRLRTASGKYRWNLDRGRVVARDGSGNPLRMVGTDTDIADRKQAEEALRQIGSLLTATGRMAKVGGWEVDAKTLELRWTEETFRIHEVPLACKPTLEEAAGFCHPDDRPKLETALQKALEHGEPYDMEYRLITTKGKQLWTRTICRPITVAGKIVKLTGAIQDITERKNAEAELRKLSVAVEQSPASIVITDPQGTIEYVNPRFTEVTGYTAEEAIGQNPRILKSGKWPKQAYKAMWDKILAGELWTGEFENKKKNGELYWEAASICPIRDAEGTITHFLAIKQDITERKEAERALQEAHDMLEQRVEERTRALVKASQAKSEFLATMSHELRTPLNGVIGMTELLLDTDLDAQQRKQASIAKSSGDLLLNLINDILDFSKIEAGKLDLECEEFNLPGALETVLSTMAQAAENKHLELLCYIDPAVPPAVLGDEPRLQQVVLNLLGNAIKFTESGEVVVRASVDAESKTHSTVRFTVTDTGIGIAPAQLDRLFKPFSQADSSTTRRYGGTGLGLAICKRLVELMGGEIGVESELRKGTSFWFAVQFEKGSEHGLQDSGMVNGLRNRSLCVDGDIATDRDIPREQLTRKRFGGQSASDGRPARILVAEDNEIGQAVVTMTLTQAGYHCDIACDGMQAVEAVGHEQYDLVLMDCRMPEMDGFDATRLIRQREAESGAARIPIVALTANALKGDRERCLEAGMDDYATKPLDPERLIQVIESLIHPEDNSMVDAQAQPNGPDGPTNKKSPIAPPAFDYDGLLKRWGGKMDFVEMLVAKFRKQAPTEVERLEQSISAGEADETMRVAHGLKGAAGYVAAERIRELAARLEEMGRAGDLSDAEAYLSQLKTEVCRCIDDSQDTSTKYNCERQHVIREKRHEDTHR